MSVGKSRSGKSGLSTSVLGSSTLRIVPYMITACCTSLSKRCLGNWRSGKWSTSRARVPSLFCKTLTRCHVEQQSSGCGRVSDLNAGSIHSGQITHLPAQSRAGFHKIRLLAAPFKAPGDLVENLVPGAQIADRLCHRNDLVEVEAVRLNC